MNTKMDNFVSRQQPKPDHVSATTRAVEWVVRTAQQAARASKVIVITGPTATGKSALAIRLSKLIGGEIVSADSMQIYKHMDIGTAKPAPEELLEVRHHMIDIIHPADEYSVSKYVYDAALCIDDIFSRGKTPVIAGGTGLYIDSLLCGRDFSARNNAGLREELEMEYESKGGEFLLSALSEFDPQSAETLHPNDKKRIVRAIEVYKTTGKTISLHNLETQLLPPRYEAVKIALMYPDRSILYDKINNRVDTMIEAGFEQEVYRLLQMNIPKTGTAMQAIGYKEMIKVIEGEISMSEAVMQIKQKSGRYAKRQLTWLRRDKSVQWPVW